MVLLLVHLVALVKLGGMTLLSRQKEFGTSGAEVDVAVARDQHHALITKLMTGPGSSEAAMHRAERVYGLSYWQQFALRYKKRATPAFIERVRQAYLSTLQQSVRRDLECLRTQAAKGSEDASIQELIVEAEDMLARLESRKGAAKV
jgi:hypothetical protein